MIIQQRNCTTWSRVNTALMSGLGQVRLNELFRRLPTRILLTCSFNTRQNRDAQENN